MMVEFLLQLPALTTYLNPDQLKAILQVKNINPILVLQAMISPEKIIWMMEDEKSEDKKRCFLQMSSNPNKLYMSILLTLD
jgi:hypothetical protein